MVLDVRTPGKYNAVHLQGAQNLDFESGTFSSEIANLDKAANYVVHCRSGNRPSQAAAQMRAAGLHVTDAGAMIAATTTLNMPIVQ